MRRDAVCCSQSCRQKLHRFGVAADTTNGETVPKVSRRAMRFAYADPPYPGMASYYGVDECDHDELIRMLYRNFPDGFALSTSSKTLAEVLSLVEDLAGDRDIIRVAAWVKGSRPGVSMRARDAWEPLIVVNGRALRLEIEDELDNVLVLSTNARQRSMPGAVIGMKTGAFAEWMFRQLGALRGDALEDLFPGSGTIGKAWQRYTRTPAGGDARATKPSRLQQAHNRRSE